MYVPKKKNIIKLSRKFTISGIENDKIIKAEKIYKNK